MPNTTRRRAATSTPHSDTAKPSTNGAGGPARVIPHDLAVEAELLGSAMLDGRAARTVARLDPDVFYRPAHQAIAHTIGRLVAEDRTPNQIEVSVAMKADGTIGILDSEADLTAIQYAGGFGPGATLAAHLVELHRARQFAGLAAEIGQAVYAVPFDRAAVETVAAKARAVTAHRTGPGGDPDPDIAAFLAGEDIDTWDWIIPDLLERGDRTMVTATEGGGKSTWFRQFAVQVAAGIHPFTLEEMAPVGVYYLDLENSERQVRRKLRGLQAKVHDRIAPGMLRIHCRPSGVDLCNPADMAWLHERLAANKPSLLITGPIYKMGLGDWLKEEVAQQMALALDELRSAHRCALLLEAHQPKAQGPSGARALGPIGSSVWQRWPEFGINLDVQGREATVRHWRGQRDERAWPSSLVRGGEWPWNPVFFSTPDSAPAPSASSLEDAKRAVARLLSEVAPEPRSVRKLRSGLRAIGEKVSNDLVGPAAEALLKEGIVSFQAGTGGAHLYRWIPDEDF